MNRIATALVLSLMAVPARAASPYPVPRPAVDTTSIPEHLQGQKLRPVSLASADFDGDGLADLAAGFATAEGRGVVVLYRGNADALYPHSPEARRRRTEGRFVGSPFLSTDRFMELSAPPDYLYAGDFDADGRADLAAAEAGGTSIEVRPGDGRLEFGPGLRIGAGGRLTALSAGDVGRRDGLPDLVAAIDTGGRFFLVVFQGPDGALHASSTPLCLRSAATAISIGGERGDAIRLRSSAGAVTRYERVAGAWRPGDEEGFAEKENAAPAGDEAAGLDLRIDSAARGRVVLRRDGTLTIASAATASTFVVDVITNLDDASPGNGVCADAGGNCSLRAAIQESNALPGADTIHFAIPGSGIPAIPVGSLPTITDPVTIDGTSQAAGRAAVTGTSNGYLLTLAAPGCVVRGLVLNGTGTAAIRLQSDGNVVEGNFIGTTDDGTAPQGSFAVMDVQIQSGSSDRIGGTTLAARNVMAGAAVAIRVDAGSGHVIEGNFIGTDVTGTVDLGGTSQGVRVFGGSATIGGSAAGAGNVIAGYGQAGVELDTPGSLVQGNRIGTNAAGTSPIGNGSGILSYFNGDGTIGGTAPGAGNLVSGNAGDGIELSQNAVSEIVIQGNRIGTDANGAFAIPNEGYGLRLVGASGTLIGGPTVAARNVVSGNLLEGIFFTKFITISPTGNVVQGNFIGTDATGAVAVPNLRSGIALEYGDANQIGGSSPGEGNVISGNFLHGIELSLTGNTTKNQIYGNRIGTNAFGNGPLGNGLAGVHIPLNTHGALIGGTGAGQANTIAFNGGAGIASSSGRALHVAPNILHSNGGLGHDLFEDGVTANRPGATNNFPVVTLASDIGGATSVAGHLDAKAATTFDVHVFSSPSCDPSGHGEGREYRKTVPVTTDAGGHGVFSTTITPAIPGGRYVTAYAVAPGTSDDSSEFSFCRQLVGGPAPEDLPLALFAATPPHGGNTGLVTLTLAGQGFVAGATARLERSGSADRAAQDVTLSPDGYTLTATFDLDGAATGLWDVTVNVSGDSATLSAAFTVEAGTEPDLWMDVLGRGTLVVRGGREQTFFAVYGNRGNTDSPPALMKVTIPRQLRVTHVEPAGASGRVVSIDSPETTGGSGRSTIWIFAESVPASSTVAIPFGVITVAAQAGEFGEEIEVGMEWTGSDGIGSLFDLPVDAGISAGATVTTQTANHLDATVHFADGGVSGDLHLDVTIADTGYEADGVHRSVTAGGHVTHTYTVAFAAGPDDPPRLYTAVLDGPEEIFALALQGTSVLEHRRKQLQEGEQFGLLQDADVLDAGQAAALNELNAFATVMDAVVAALLPQLSLAPRLRAGDPNFGIRLQEMKERLDGAAGKRLYQDYLANFEEWNLKLYGGDNSQLDTRTPRSRKEIIDRVDQLWRGDGADHGTAIDIVKVYLALDPNEKKGPTGMGDAGWIDGATPLAYTITFENLETANAAAQEVVVTDQLDGSKLDFGSFALGPIAFGMRVVPVPPGSQSFAADVDLRPEIDLVARVAAGFDPTTGVATWHFFSLDPSTGQPTDDPLLGFLPPNVATPEGEGHVSFTIAAKPGLASGTEIHNQASIVFDANDPIVTADWRNTVDVTAPASAIAPIAADCSGIAVSWSGTDAHSGIAAYDVLVSENGGPFQPWRTATTATSGVFFGVVGSTYGFQSVATDAAGNREAPGAAEATAAVSSVSALLDALEPDSGPATGAAVTLTGSGFQAGAAVTAGSQPAGSVVVDGPDTIQAVFPALAPGALYDVAVENVSGCGDTFARSWFADFLDVPGAHSFHDFVEKIVRRGVTAGCSGGNYCVGNAVTRAQMAVFLTKAKYFGTLVPPAASGALFGDVPAGAFAASFIEQIAKEGITGGCGGGNYCPANAVTRRQMAVFLLKSKHGALYAPPPAAGVFADVPAADPFAPWIEELAAEGITAGCGGNNYCPGNPVTRGQMAVFLVKTFGF